MFGEKMIQDTILKLIDKHPEIVTRVAKKGMRIEMSTSTNDQGQTVLKSTVYWFDDVINSTEVVLP